MLIPAYRPLLKLAKPVQKLITIWPENATSTLQDCFQCTDWNMFKEAATYNNHTDLQEYTETVTAYIEKCMDDVTVTKTITTRANQKPWMTAEVRGLLKTRDEAFRSGDKQPSKQQEPICPVASKMQNGHMLKKLTITSRTAETHGACGKPFRPSLTTSPCHRPVMMIHPSPIHSTTFIHGLKCRMTHLHKNCPHLPMTRPAADVRKTLSRIYPRKAACPDNIPGRVLKDCAAQLMDVLTDIFNTSLSQAVVPTCLKSTTIIPVPKKSPVSCLNDYRPIALTPIIIKCFERLVMQKSKPASPTHSIHSSLHTVQTALRTMQFPPPSTWLSPT